MHHLRWRPFINLMLSAGLAMTVQLAAPRSALAILTCDTKYVVLYQEFNGQGSSRMLCKTDYDIESESPLKIIGPIGDIEPYVYKDDFDNAGWSSGVSSIYFYDAPGGTDYRVCIYGNPYYSGILLQYPNTGLYSFTGPGELGQMNDLAGMVEISTGNCGQ